MEYLLHIAIIIAIYGTLALSLNLVVGYTGLLSAAHAAFYGIGAYGAAIMMTRMGVSFWVGAVAGILASMAVATFIGFVLSRFKHDYYVLVSLGLNVIIYNILLNWQELTRGPLGIPGIPRPSVFGFVLQDNVFFLLLAGLVLVAVYALSRYIAASSFGRALKAIREDEQALQVFGYKTHHFKLVIFIISAGMAALAGSLFAAYITFIDPSTFAIAESIFLLSIVILGGLASLRGSIVGAVIMVLLPELLRFVGFPSDIAAQMRQVVYGLLLILLMLYRPQGISGEYKL